MSVEKVTEVGFIFPKVSDVVMASERLIFNTTEDILLAMQDSGMNQSDLAKKMGKSKAFVSQILDGSRNLTLKTLSDITYALGAEVRLSIMKDGRDVSHHVMPERENYTTQSNEINMLPGKVIRLVVAPSNVYSHSEVEYEQYAAI